MTSTRKTLMIAGGLLVAAAGTAYVMLLRADHRAIEDAGIGDSAVPVAAAPANNDHAVQGAIAPPASPAPAAHADTASKQAAVPPPPSAPAPATPAPARVSAAPASVPAVPVVSEKAQPSAPPPKVNVVTVDAQDSTPPAAAPAAKPAQPPAPAQVTQRAPRKRDGLERHAAVAPAATKSETPETAALVRESAKLDPSLPAPSMSSSSGPYRQGSSSSGANPVAAAMTEQLVRESSSLKSPPSAAPANGGPSTTK
ncbi:extensin [Burkholderia lata]|uniref:Extensin n=1 Tax=Burkholderia lata (strain ATCC 17760 / DSM 23089 / LMG 22485 / NCIMB 9086 / R18194 / 383) TaxID=482957 RepID=A0A6P2LQN7_BURL3|nr:extensin [Burkholderia lata]VWB69538.1 extensin [Burkholderia lata]